MLYCFMVKQSTTMSSLTANDDCLGWAARDASGVLSPYNFSRRCVYLFFFEGGKDDRVELFKEIKQEKACMFIHHSLRAHLVVHEFEHRHS